MRYSSVAQHRMYGYRFLAQAIIPEVFLRARRKSTLRHRFWHKKATANPVRSRSTIAHYASRAIEQASRTASRTARASLPEGKTARTNRLVLARLSENSGHPRNIRLRSHKFSRRHHTRGRREVGRIYQGIGSAPSKPFSNIDDDTITVPMACCPAWS